MGKSGFRAMPALALAACLLLPAGPAGAEDPKSGSVEWVPELTPYYTSLGLYLTLADPIAERDGQDELAIYQELFMNSLSPQLLLLEASAYPMPIAGTWVRRHDRKFYDDAEIDRLNVNWIESLTAGFQEPAALSVFVGSAMNFVRPGEKRLGTNKGMMGYLLSVGDRHIRENVMVPDDWYELEWKLKGDRQFSDDHLSWSFRIGTKQNSNPEIADTVYLGLKRANLDFRAPLLSFLTNSQIAVLVAATTDGLALARTELIGEKRYPMRWCNCAVAMQLGAIVEKNRQYLGSLYEEKDHVILVLRPNLEF